MPYSADPQSRPHRPSRPARGPTQRLIRDPNASVIVRRQICRNLAVARWAMVFDGLGVRWEASPEWLSPHWTPQPVDFALPSRGLFVAVVDAIPDLLGIAGMNRWEPLVRHTGQRLALITPALFPGPNGFGPEYGAILFPREPDALDEGPGPHDVGCDFAYAFVECPACRQVDFTFMGRLDRLPCGCYPGRTPAGTRCHAGTSPRMRQIFGFAQWHLAPAP